MFILDSHELKSTMFSKRTKADSDTELWHKRIGHINLNKLQAMQSKGVVIELPTFKEKDIEGVCKACQFRKQHWHSFPKERNVRKGLLDVVVKIFGIGLKIVWKGQLNIKLSECEV